MKFYKQFTNISSCQASTTCRSMYVIRQRAASRESSIAPYSSVYSRQSKMERKAVRRKADTSGPLLNHNKSRLGLSPENKKNRGDDTLRL